LGHRGPIDNQKPIFIGRAKGRGLAEIIPLIEGPAAFQTLQYLPSRSAFFTAAAKPRRYFLYGGEIEQYFPENRVSPHVVNLFFPCAQFYLEKFLRFAKLSYRLAARKRR
jgi:hypothetical protein